MFESSHGTPSQLHEIVTAPLSLSVIVIVSYKSTACDNRLLSLKEHREKDLFLQEQELLLPYFNPFSVHQETL